MEQFATEEQQVEAIKRFWKENGPAVIIGAVLGLGGLWGWRYYNEQQITAQEQASVSYQQAIEALASGSEGYTTAVDFVNEHQDNGYAILTAFQLAKEAVERKDLPEAAKQLDFVVTHASEGAIKNMAKLRLARVQMEQAELDAALTTLNAVTAEAFKGQVEESKGDVYVRQQMFDKAKAAYNAALEVDENNPLVKMKLDNLAVAANG